MPCLTDARRLLSLGRLEEAAAVCRAVLADDVVNPGALHVLGLVLLGQGSTGEAISLLSAAAASSSERDIARDLATALRLAQVPQPAAAISPAGAPSPDPDATPAAAMAAASALLTAGDAGEGIARLQAATQRWPDVSELWFALGCALGGRSDNDAAAQCYRKAVALDPRCMEAHNNLGNVLLALCQPEAAVEAYRAAIALRPDMPELWFGLANALIEAKQPGEAEAACHRALELRPDCVEALNSLGNALLAQHRAGEALAAYRGALAVRPAAPELMVGLGNALLESGDAVGAEQICRAIRVQRPDFADAAQNLGNALMAQHRLDEALDAYADAVRLAPEAMEHRNNYGLMLLLAGRFAEGWRENEFRRANPKLRDDYARRPELPRWQPGMPLQGKRVLVMMEQGYGDQIQFLRYVPMLAAAGAQVTVEVPRGLQPVLPDLARAVRVIAPEDPAPYHDIAVPLLSLALYFDTGADSIPAPIPYAAAPPDQVAVWQEWLGPRQGRRIGLVCSGRPSYGLDRHRSIPLAAFAPLRDLAAQFVLLQPEMRERDEAARAAWPALRWPGAALRDFGDTAALVAALDLVISVDTSVAHLAGAMGRPVWTLLPFVPDWRWRLGRRDTPWYPTMRLYRQERSGDWAGVVEAVRRDLAAMGARDSCEARAGFECAGRRLAAIGETEFGA